MSRLVIDPNMRDGDGFYASLLAAHEGLTAEQSNQLNARLVLILANHIGDQAAVAEAIELAQKTQQV